MPTNPQISALLRNLATMIELDGKARSRSRSLRAAADALDALEQPVTAALLEEGALELTEEPREVIRELLAQGACALYDELLTRYPLGIVEIADLPNIGPARALHLRDDLGVRNLSDLVVAAEQKRLTEVKGIGARTAEKILESARAALAAKGPQAAPTSTDDLQRAIAEFMAEERSASRVTAAAPPRAAAAPPAQLELVAALDDLDAPPAAAEAPAERARRLLDDLGDDPIVDAPLDPEEPGFVPAAQRSQELRRPAAVAPPPSPAAAPAPPPTQAAPSPAEAAQPTAAPPLTPWSWLLAHLRCAACQHVGLREDGPTAACPSCGRRFPLEGEVLDMVGSRPTGSTKRPSQRLMEFAPYSSIYERFSRPAFTLALARRPVSVEYDLAARVANPRPGARVLDVACGTGNFARALAERVEGDPASSVVGLDLSWPMLHEAHANARRYGLHHLSFVRGDALRLPFGDGAFDLVHCAGAFHLLPDPDRALAEFHRALKPGGALVLSTFVRSRNPLIQLPLSTFGRLSGITWFTSEGLQRRLDDLGLRVIEHHRSGQAVTFKALRSTTP